MDNNDQRPPTTQKSCPYCGENILIEAIKCKHCGSMLSLDTASGTSLRISSQNAPANPPLTDWLLAFILPLSLLIDYFITPSFSSEDKVHAYNKFSNTIYTILILIILVRGFRKMRKENPGVKINKWAGALTIIFGFVPYYLLIKARIYKYSRLVSYISYVAYFISFTYILYSVLNVYNQTKTVNEDQEFDLSQESYEDIITDEEVKDKCLKWAEHAMFAICRNELKLDDKACVEMKKKKEIKKEYQKTCDATIKEFKQQHENDYIASMFICLTATNALINIKGESDYLEKCMRQNGFVYQKQQ